jgi:hypothetical protein
MGWPAEACCEALRTIRAGFLFQIREIKSGLFAGDAVLKRDFYLVMAVLIFYNIRPVICRFSIKLNR